jgi:hypothetical protein
LVPQQFTLAKVDILEVTSAPNPARLRPIASNWARTCSGKLEAAGAGAPTLQEIIGKEFHVGPQGFGPNLLQELLRWKVRGAGLRVCQRENQNQTQNGEDRPG